MKELIIKGHPQSSCGVQLQVLVDAFLLVGDKVTLQTDETLSPDKEPTYYIKDDETL